MTRTMQYGPAGLALTKSFEGCELTAYQDQRGVWTIGWGHTGNMVYEGQTITQQQADVLLQSDLLAAVWAVNHFVDAAVMLTQNQFDALVDFAFNVGVSALHGSTLLRMVNDGDFTAAAEQFKAWDHVRGVIVPGLLRRREAEAALFRTPDATQTYT